MKEYECKDIIKSINDKRRSLKEVVLIRVLTMIVSSKEKINNNSVKDEITRIANEVGKNNKEWIEGRELPEIIYNPRTGENTSEQRTRKPKTSNKKDKETFNNNLHTVNDYTVVSFHEFTEIAKKYLDTEKIVMNEQEKEVQKTLTPEKKRVIEDRIDFAKNNIKSMTTILTNVTVNITLNSVASQMIIKKMNEMTQSPGNKDIGKKLASKFMELIFYSSLLSTLTKNSDPQMILQDLNNNKSQFSNLTKYFSDNQSIERANGFLKAIEINLKKIVIKP